MVLYYFALFTDVFKRDCEKVANSMGFVYGPCIHVRDRVDGRVLGRVLGRVHGPYMAQHMAVYTVMYTSCTRLCTRAVYTVGRVHGPYTAVKTTCIWIVSTAV